MLHIARVNASTHLMYWKGASTPQQLGSAKKPIARNFEEMTQQANAFVADTKYYKETYAKANPPVERRLGEKKKTKRKRPVLDIEGNKMEEPDAKYDKYKSIYQIQRGERKHLF